MKKPQLDIVKEKVEKMKDCPTKELILKDIPKKELNKTITK